MSALITNVEHALAVAASDTVKVAKFVETSVLPALKTAKAEESTIEAVTALVSPSAANIERAGFAVFGVVINAMDAAGRKVTRAFRAELLRTHSLSKEPFWQRIPGCDPNAQ